MTPDELEKDQILYVSTSLGEDHPVLDPSDMVKVINPVPDEDGQVFVNAFQSDGAALGAWVDPEHLITEEQAEGEFPSTPDIEVGESFSPGEIQFDPHHPEYEWLPAYDALPLGYVLGLLRHFQNLGQPPPQPHPFIHYLNNPGFPTA